MVRQIELQGFYWPTFMMDSDRYAQECEKCHRFAHLHHVPSNELTSITSLWPFI